MFSVQEPGDNLRPIIRARDNQSSIARFRWGIVLAGGEGTRMAPLMRSWLGAHYPKQYCTFIGSRSMFQHTIDRACSLVPKENVVSIIGRGHRKFLGESEGSSPPGLVLEQPRDMGTAAGAFLSLAYVLSTSPNATAIILPSSHFVLPEEHFRREMLRAMQVAESNHDQLVLAGAIPDRANGEYDWIGPELRRSNNGTSLSGRAGNIIHPRNITGSDEERELVRQGYLWNTTIVVAKAKLLWSLAREYLPEMMAYYDAFLTVLRAVREQRLDPCWESSSMEALYNSLSPVDFSEDFLRLVSMRSTVLRVDGVYWSDWRDPQQVSDTLARIGRRPLFESIHPEHARTPEPKTLESW